MTLKRIIIICLLGFGINAHAFKAMVFVSFSMPPQLLKQTLIEAASLHLPVLLNGLVNNSMPETIQAMQDLSAEIKGVSIAIDPVSFDEFKISQVPALVVSLESTHDVVYGNLALIEGLKLISEKGETGFQLSQLKDIS